MTLAYTNNASAIMGMAQVVPAAITSTGLDTTATVNSQVFSNLTGDLKFFSGAIAATDKTGTSPTLQLILQGSNDGTNFFTLKDDAGNSIQTSATSISSSGSGTTVVVQTDTAQLTLRNFPPYVRAQVVVGGSSSPGWNGTVALTLLRDRRITTL